MKVTAILLVAVVGIVVLVCTGVAIYEAGQGDAAPASIECPASAVIMKVTFTESADVDGKTSERTITLGSCSRLSEDAYEATLRVLADQALSTTTCTTSGLFVTATSPLGTTTTVNRPSDANSAARAAPESC